MTRTWTKMARVVFSHESEQPEQIEDKKERSLNSNNFSTEYIRFQSCQFRQ